MCATLVAQQAKRRHGKQIDSNRPAPCNVLVNSVFYFVYFDLLYTRTHMMGNSILFQAQYSSSDLLSAVACLLPYFSVSLRPTREYCHLFQEEIQAQAVEGGELDYDVCVGISTKKLVLKESVNRSHSFSVIRCVLCGTESRRMLKASKNNPETGKTYGEQEMKNTWEIYT